MRLSAIVLAAVLVAGCGATWDYKLPHERCDPCCECPDD